MPMDAWINIALGLGLLFGGELLVRGAVASAKSLGVSPLLIGLALVGFGTSTPELVTSVTAALNGSPGIAVGSNIANILFILGLSAVIFPMAANPKGFKRDAIMVTAAALACMGVVMYGRMGMLVRVAYGNIVGSNIFNVLFILGTTAIIQPIEMPGQIATFDIWVMLSATALLVYFGRTGTKLQRWR